VEGGESTLGDQVGVGPVVNQEPNHLDVTVSGGKVEWSNATLEKF
jgi:hypothetical protein